MLLSRRVTNDEAALTGLITAVLSLAEGDEAVWATDLNAGGAALLLALLADRNAAGALPTRSDRSPRRGDLPR